QRQRLTVHRPDDEVVLVHGLLDRHAARERDAALVAGKMRVGAVVAGEDGGRLHPGGPEYVGKAHAGPFPAPRAAIGPLVAARLGMEERAAVAAAFEHHPAGDRTKL